MKISKSKQELARIISENGGWQEYCEWAAQDKSGEFGENSVILFEGKDKPIIEAGMSEWMCAEGYESDSSFGKHVFNSDKLVKNWHQTILSRDEYFRLYPVAETEPEQVAEAKPTIEQLAADYRNLKGYADRKQQEADAAKDNAESKLAELIAAGKELNLVISVAEEDPELVIAELTDLKIGDEVDATYRGIERVVGRVMNIDFGDKNQPVFVSDGERSIWATEWKFIRRP